MKITNKQRYFLHWILNKTAMFGRLEIDNEDIKTILEKDEYNIPFSNELNKLGEYYKKVYREQIGKEHYYNTVLKGRKFKVAESYTPDIAYNLGRIENDKVYVSWNMVPGEGWTTYDLTTILRYINSGEWTIQPRI